MNEASIGLDKIYAVLARIEDLGGQADDDSSDESGSFWEGFREAMDDDFNSARGIGILFDAVRNSNRLLDEGGDNIQPDIRAQLETIRSDMLKMGDILGILQENPKRYFEKKRSKALVEDAIDPAIIEALIQDRKDARENRAWDKADQIRSKLEAMNVILEDRAGDTTWKIKS
jgi:cysteinyl-tRNA synthetase